MPLWPSPPCSRASPKPARGAVALRNRRYQQTRQIAHQSILLSNIYPEIKRYCINTRFLPTKLPQSCQNAARRGPRHCMYSQVHFLIPIVPTDQNHSSSEPLSPISISHLTKQPFHASMTPSPRCSNLAIYGLEMQRPS